MVRILMTGSYWNSKVCEWLVNYLISPNAYDSLNTGLIKRNEGQLLINEKAILDGWKLYLNTNQEAEIAKIGTALRTLSKGHRKQLRNKGARIRYRVVDLEHLYAWADRCNIGDKETLLETMKVEA